jgi:head-tail adaptor
VTAGARDTLIKFEARATTRDETYGTTVEGPWSEVSSAWAEVQDFLPSRSESVDQSVSMQRRPARIRVDYFDGVDVTSAMRIDVDGRKLRIVSGPAHKRDSDEWEMVAEELSSEGQEA